MRGFRLALSLAAFVGIAGLFVAPANAQFGSKGGAKGQQKSGMQGHCMGMMGMGGMQNSSMQSPFTQTAMSGGGVGRSTGFPNTGYTSGMQNTYQQQMMMQQQMMYYQMLQQQQQQQYLQYMMQNQAAAMQMMMQQQGNGNGYLGR